MELDIVESSGPPCFLADRMLGKLARWLRLLGYDALYLPQLSADGVLREARRQSRFILTRDRRIGRRPNVAPFLFIDSDHFREQLSQVVLTLGLDISRRLLTRCSLCNHRLTPIERESVGGLVPDYVLRTHDTFQRCPGCRRVYWGATHKAHILHELGSLGLLAQLRP